MKKNSRSAAVLLALGLVVTGPLAGCAAEAPHSAVITAPSDSPSATPSSTTTPSPAPAEGDSEGQEGRDGEAAPMKFTDADIKTFSDYASAAVPAYVAYSTTESTADRAARLAPWFGTSDIVVQKPILARADLETRPGWVSTVEAKDVYIVTQSSPKEGDPIDSVRFAVYMNYVADWRSDSVPGAVQTGGEPWEVRLPVVKNADGSWSVGNADDVLIFEPAIDVGS